MVSLFTRPYILKCVKQIASEIFHKSRQKRQLFMAKRLCGVFQMVEDFKHFKESTGLMSTATRLLLHFKF